MYMREALETPTVTPTKLSVGARRDLSDLRGPNSTLEAAARVFVKAALIKPDEFPDSVGDRRCSSSTVPAGGASVSEELGVAEGGLDISRMIAVCSVAA